MKTLAIISEFNPFHNGHKYLLDKAKEKTQADFAISFMSGDFVQRGEPALIDKFNRADSSIKAGFDIVVEMPAYISLQSAEYFALGSIKILEKIGVDYLCFGIENISENIFLENVDTLISKTDKLNELTRKNLDSSSFTKARYDATVEILGDNSFITSNNVLALEYIRAIKKINSKIIPIPINRISSINTDKNLQKSTFSSSTAIRNNIFKNYKDHVPNYSYKSIEESKKRYGIRGMEYEYSLFKYLLLIENKKMDDILAYEEGIENYLARLAASNNLFKDFINEATTKRYTSSRIRRLMLNYILDNKTIFNDYDLDFYRVLAFRQESSYIFRNSKNKPIITKKDSENISKTDKFILSKMIDASNLYNLGMGREINQDFSKKIRRY